MKQFLRISLYGVVAFSFVACSKKPDATVDTTAAVVAPIDTAVSAPVVESVKTAVAIVPIDINKASDEEILKIPGVGPKMLHEFKEYRPWTSVEQFRREIGKYADKAEVARLEQYIVIK
ncbi:MAG: helix-hairpin-helix domain-containing protein [Gemmatimonadaceae bacterium]|nr:helix-hairpin-helix domain-containing protein [Gemmatimonadaceae bacterium]